MGRKIFGSIRFKGLVKSRPLRELIHADIMKAFKDTDFKITGHIIKRLKDIRTYNIGIKTLDDFAKHLSEGVVIAAEGSKLGDKIILTAGKFKIIIGMPAKSIVSLVPFH